VTNGSLLPELPTVLLGPLADLAAAARRSPRFQAVRGLAEWVGERAVTSTGVLLLADAKAAVAELGLPAATERKPRSARDFEELSELWTLAIEAGLLDVGGRMVRPGPSLEAVTDAEDDEAALDGFADILDASLDQFGEAALLPLVNLYVTGRPTKVADLVADLVMDSADAELTDHAEMYLRELVQVLRDLGAVEGNGEEVALTALGIFGVGCWFATFGIDAPSVSSLSEASARDLLHLGARIEELAQLDVLFADWVSAHGEHSAAAQLLGLARTGAAHERSVAFAMLAQIPEAAAPAVRDAMDDPAIRAYGSVWLRSAGLEGPDPSPDDRNWMLVDVLAGQLDDEEGLAEHMLSELAAQSPPDEQLAVVADLWRVRHPQVVPVLEMLGRHHPDAKVAKAARKAALQARSRQAATPKRRSKGKQRSDNPGRVDAVPDTYQLKITLANIRPAIWRRVQVPGSMSLAELHHVIQTTMGWEDSHLHEFDINGERYGVPGRDVATPYGGPKVHNEATTSLRGVAGAGDRMLYTYDFGDDWEHLVVVEDVLESDPGTALPVCIGGRRACPPEDVGGAWGYADVLEALDDPEHANHEHWTDWIEPDFDPERFDAAEVTRRLQRR
jgi:hypothetical protein